MKNFIAAVLLMLCFGVANAHLPKKIHPAFTQKKFVVTGINRLKDYNVPFRFYSPRIIWKQNAIETTVNSIGVEVSQTKIAISSIEKDRKGFARILSSVIPRTVLSFRGNEESIP